MSVYPKVIADMAEGVNNYATKGGLSSQVTNGAVTECVYPKVIADMAEGLDKSVTKKVIYI